MAERQMRAEQMPTALDSPPCRVRILCGATRSQRASCIDQLLVEHWGRAVLLVPTRQQAARRTEQVMLEADVAAAWGRPILTFGDFATELLRAEGKRATRINDDERRLLLERVLDGLRKEPHFSALGASAETHGFVTHLLRVITQIKQAALEPREFRERVRRRKHASPLDAVVADAYAGYQDALLATGLYDAPGLFWEANVICGAGQPRGLGPLTTLLLDGFDDFTPSEFRLLTSLASHVELLVFGFEYDADPGKRDRYEVSARTIANVRRTFNTLVESFEEGPPARLSEFCASHIFSRDFVQLPDGIERNIEIVPCIDAAHETETIARRVKTLLLNGARAENIAVVYRSLGDEAQAVRSTFESFGIPIRVQQPLKLWDSAVGGFVASLLDALALWQRDDVVDILTSPWFAVDETLLYAVPLLARMSQVVSGREEWTSRVEALAARVKTRAGEDIESLLEKMPDAAQTIESLQQQITRIEGFDKGIPPEASESVLIDALAGLLDQLQLHSVLSVAVTEDMRASEEAALAGLHALLGEWRLWVESESRVEKRSAFVAKFRRMLQDTPFHAPSCRKGILCLDADSARGLHFDHVFLAGANEGLLPCPPPSNAIYPEDDVDSLRNAGIEIDDRRLHGKREMLLFHHLLTMPRVHLCITWRTLSQRGKPLNPSPFLADLLSLAPMPEVSQSLPHAASFVPSLAEVASLRDVRNASFYGAAAGMKTLRKRFPEVLASAEIERARHDQSPFGVHDGILSNSAVVSLIAGRYGKRHLFSVNQIESYAACPFRFFVENVLRIDETEAPTAEFDSRIRGLIMHEALQVFHERFRGIPVCAIDAEEAAQAMREALATAFDAKGWMSRTAPMGVALVERQWLDSLLRRYLLIEHERENDPWKPTHFEVSFGKAPRSRSDANPDPLTTQEAFELTLDKGESALFSGRIDRIDIQEGMARVIDYKSTDNIAQKDIKDGRSIQLTLYALAIEELLFAEATCAEAYFIPVGRQKWTEGLQREKGEWKNRLAVLKETVKRSLEGIRAGQFPPVPSSDQVCRHCSAGRACRYEQARIERKVGALS